MGARRRDRQGEAEQRAEKGRDRRRIALADELELPMRRDADIDGRIGADEAKGGPEIDQEGRSYGFRVKESEGIPRVREGR